MWMELFTPNIFIMLIILISPLHPSKMIMALLLFTLILLLNMMLMGPMIYTFIMFLIMIGGVIIVMLFFTGLIILPSSKLLIINLIYLILWITLSILIYLNWKLYFEFNDFFYKNNQLNFYYFENFENLTINLMYSSKWLTTIMYCMNILLIILYFIMKISSKMIKPFRSLSN